MLVGDAWKAFEEVFKARAGKNLKEAQLRREICGNDPKLADQGVRRFPNQPHWEIGGQP
jgi:hypothetical protein